MPKYFVQYHRVSVSESIDTETDVPFIAAEVNSDISQRCKKCQVLLYIIKTFKKHEKIYNICYDLLNNKRESGSIQIVWTENQKFWVFTNVYPPCAIELMEKEQPTAVSGYLDLNGKYTLFDNLTSKGKFKLHCACRAWLTTHT